MSDGPEAFLQFLIKQSNLLGGMRDMEKNVMPTEAQFALQPGDVGIISTGGNAMDHDMIVAEILNPEEYAESFPDWEARAKHPLTPYLLCSWKGATDPAGDIGWFASIRFIKLLPEQYAEALGWIVNEELPEESPSWLTDYFEQYTRDVHAQSPSKIPVVVSCERCQKSNTEIHVRSLHKMSARVGKVVGPDGEDLYTTISDQEEGTEHAVHVHCKDCGFRKHLNSEQVNLHLE